MRLIPQKYEIKDKLVLGTEITSTYCNCIHPNNVHIFVAISVVNYVVEIPGSIFSKKQARQAIPKFQYLQLVLIIITY